MSDVTGNLNPSRCTPGLATFVSTLAVAWVFVAHAQAQQPPYALFERSTLTASGNTISAIQVPVVLGSGITVYLNLSMQFAVDSTGNLTLAPGYPQVSLAPILLTGSFVAGRYRASGGMSFNVTGPGVLDGGVTQWSLGNATDCSASGTWYAGPIASNPLAARLRSAGITSTAWSYGIGSSVGGCSFIGPNPWPGNGLIGVSQVGNTLTFVSFTSNAADTNLPVAQITSTLAP